MIKELPYPFDKLFSIASDCDAMEKKFLIDFHKCLNNYHGLFFTNSFWYYSSDSNTKLALTKSPNEFINNSKRIINLIGNTKSFWYNQYSKIKKAN